MASELPTRQGRGTLAGTSVSAAFVALAAVPTLVIAGLVLISPSVVPAGAAAVVVVVAAARAMFRPHEHD